MWRNPACVSMLVCMVFLTGACNTVPFQNKPLAHYTQQAGYRYTGIAPGDDNSDSLCVIVTFSGGGTRAAAFSFGVLEKLRDTEIVWEGKQRRLLDEVDIISSVSGGSLPSAYYGLFGDRIFEDFPDKVLYRNIQGNIVESGECLSILNIILAGVRYFDIHYSAPPHDFITAFSMILSIPSSSIPMIPITSIVASRISARMLFLASII